MSSSRTSPEANRSPLALFRNPEFVALASVRFVSGMAFATILIALALYADLFEASGLIAGLFGSAYAIVRLLVGLPFGRKIDLGNSKRYLLIGLGLNVVVLAGFTLIESVEHIIVLRGLQALGSILLWITGIAVVGEIAPDDGRGLWIGTYNQVKAVASLCGDLIGGGLLFLYGFGTAYTVLIALTIVSTIAVFTFVRNDPGTQSNPEDATGAETFVRLLKRRVIKALVVFRFGFSFGKMAVILFLPIYARTEFGMTALLIGGILAGGKLTKGVAQGYVGEFADRVGGLKWFIFAGTVVYALGTALIPAAGYISQFFDPLVLTGFGQELTLIPAFFALFLAYTILGIAESLRLPTSMALFVEEGEHYDAVAGSLSLRSVSWQFGAILGPLLVGAALDYLSVLAGFWLAAAFMVIAGFAFIGLYQIESPPDFTTEAINND